MTNRLDNIMSLIMSDASEKDKLTELSKIMFAGGQALIATAKVGDVVNMHCVNGYGGHSARIEIVKINRKTIVGYEIGGSYRAGTKWHIDIDVQMDRGCVDHKATKDLADGRLKSMKPLP